MRLQLQECLGSSTPLATKASIALKEGKLEEASRLLSECLQCDDETRRDPRFFHVFWSLGKLELARFEEDSALSTKTKAILSFEKAVLEYAKEARESHYLEVAGQLLASPLSDREMRAAVVVQHGLKNCPESARLRALNGDLEMPNTRAQRPAFPRRYLA